MTERTNQVVKCNEAAKSTSFELTRFNAVRHGVLSRYTVLPWESETEYQDST